MSYLLGALCKVMVNGRMTVDHDRTHTRFVIDRERDFEICQRRGHLFFFFFFFESPKRERAAAAFCIFELKFASGEAG